MSTPSKLLATLLLCLGRGASEAQEPAPPTAQEPAEKPAEERAAQTADPAGERKAATLAGSEGFVVESENGEFRLEIRGYAQLDGRFFPGDEAGVAVDGFVVRRVRPMLQGTVLKYFDFNIGPDFGGGTTVLQDAYLDVHYSPKARLRAGKFKAPVGLERLQSAAVMSFVERAFPTALVPNRDVGFELYGELARGVVAYAVGLFDGAPDGGSVDLDSNDGKDLAGRLFLSPFKRGKSFLKDLGFGIAGTRGPQAGPLPAYRSGGQTSIISVVAGVTADGIRKRYSPQLSLYSGRFGLLAEYVRSQSAVRRADGTPARLDGRAWQTTATVALTGDKASYAGVRPRRPFDPGRGHWGALELAARVNGIELARGAAEAGLIEPTTSVRKAFAWALGLNWSLNRNIRQLFDYERTTFSGGAPRGADRAPENALFIRTQVAF